MAISPASLIVLLAPLALGQERGTVSSQVYPVVTTSKCTKTGGCFSQDTKVTLDANWRWLHGPSPTNKNCYSGSIWDSTLYPDSVTCAKNCAIDGADCGTTYDITASGGTLTMLLFPQGRSISSRVYLMSDDNNCQLFKIKN